MSDKDLGIPIHAQMAVVNKMVLPLLKKMNINVTVTTKADGMVLNLTFTEPPVEAAVPDRAFGTDTPDEASQLWELRQKIEDARAKYGVPDPNA